MGLLARLGIRSPEQTTPATPPAGQRALYAKTGGWYDLDSAGVETLIGSGGGGGAPIPTNYLRPAAASYETFTRNGSYSGTSVTPSSGRLYLVAIALPVGLSVGSIAFFTLAAAVTPTHWWFGLYDQGRAQLATTADQLTAPWAANTMQSLPITTTAAGAATTYTTTYTGLHYLGYVMTATTQASLGSSVMSSPASAQAPILSGNSSTAQTVPPAFPFTAATIASTINLPYAYVGP